MAKTQQLSRVKIGENTKLFLQPDVQNYIESADSIWASGRLQIVAMPEFAYKSLTWEQWANNKKNVYLYGLECVE